MKKYLPIIILILFGVFFIFPERVLAGSGITNIYGNGTNFSDYSNSSYVYSQNAHASTLCWSQNFGTNGGCRSAYYTSAYNVYIEVYTCTSDTGAGGTFDRVKCDGGNGGNRPVNYQLKPSDGTRDFLLSNELPNYKDFCKVQMDMYFNGDVRNWVVYRNDDKCGAPPPPQTQTLTVSRSGGSNPRVDSDQYNFGISCGSDCYEVYPKDHWLWLWATPDTGGSVSWSGCNEVPAGYNGLACTVQMTSDKSIIATFTQGTKTLEIQKNGSGSGRIYDNSNPGNLDCGSDCFGIYTVGSWAYVDATVTSGSVFDGWTNCDFITTSVLGNAGHRCGVKMDNDRTLIASFSNSDVTPPVCGTISTNPVSPLNSSSVTISAIASDNTGIARGGLYVLQPNGVNVELYSNNNRNSGNLSKVWTTPSASGTYKIQANWWDGASNFKQCIQDFVIDKTPPITSFTGPTQVCFGSTQTYSISAGDNNKLQRVYLAYAPTTLPQTWNAYKPYDNTAVNQATLSPNGIALLTFSTANGFSKGVSYYLASGAFDKAGNKCSGNPFYFPTPGLAGWSDCGTNSRKTVSVVGASTAPTLNSVSTGVLNRINLAWTDRSNDENSFLIYRNGAFLTTVGINSTSFSDTTAVCSGTNFSYYVVANNSYNSCGGNVSVVKAGNCKTNRPTTCGAWSFNPSSPSATNSLAVTARASDPDGLETLHIKGYRGGGSSNTIYAGASTGVSTGTWNTSGLTTGVYQLDADWWDAYNFKKTCSTTYSIDKTAPSTPGAITANATCAGVSGISWGASTDSGAVATGLKNYQFKIDEGNNGGACSTSGSSGDLCFNTTSTSFNTYNFKKGTTYKITVTATDNAGNVSSATSKIVTTTSDPTAPAVTATVSLANNRNITLSWLKGIYNASNYTVNSSDTVGAVTCSGSACSAVVTQAACGTRSYSVTVRNSCGYSSTSAPATATSGSFIAKPVVTATLTGDTVLANNTKAKVILSWANDSKASSFTVNGSGTKSAPSCSGATCTSTVTNLTCTTTYAYSVTANNNCGTNTSNNISVKPNCKPSCSITGGNSSPYGTGIIVPLGSSVTDEGGAITYDWTDTGGSVSSPRNLSTNNYTTSLANGVAPRVDLNISDKYGASNVCSKIISTIAGVIGTHSLASGSINRVSTSFVIVAYSISSYRNQDSAGSSINATATINTGAGSICNTIATCNFINAGGTSIGQTVSVAQGNTSLRIKVTLNSPNNLASGAYTMPVNFTSSVGNITPISTITVTNRPPTCTITGINSATLYNRSQVIPITLNSSDADGDTITSQTVSASCGSVSGLTSYTTSSVNNATCVLTGTVSDGTVSSNCYATAKTKAPTITFSFTAVPNINRTAKVTVVMPFTVTMENDQNGTLAVATDPTVAVPGGGFTNICKISGVTCTLSNNTIIPNNPNSKSVSVTIPKAVLMALDPTSTKYYAVRVNASAPTNAVGVTSPLTGSGGVSFQFNNASPVCNAPSITPSAMKVYGSRYKLGESITLTANATDPDNAVASLTYTWAPSSVNGVFSNISTNKIDYATDNEFNKVDSYSYIATDAYGATCIPFASSVGTEDSTVVSGRVFEVQVDPSQSMCDVVSGNSYQNDSSTFKGVSNIKLIDNKYSSISSLEKITNGAGKMKDLELSVDSSGNSTVCLSNVPDGFVLADATCIGTLSGLSVTNITKYCFKISGMTRGGTSSMFIPLQFSPNPYIVSQEGDIYSRSNSSPILNRPVITTVDRLISNIAGTSTYGMLLSGATNHDGINWDNSKVDFTVQKGVSGQANIANDSAGRFTRPGTGVFDVIKALDNKGQLGSAIVYKDSGVNINSNTEYLKYKEKILVVNGGDVIIDAEAIGSNNLSLFIIATGKITLTQFTNCTPITNCQKTINITGALYSGVGSPSGGSGSLDLQYGIKVNNSADNAYKNPSIKMIFDPSIYLNSNVNGLKVLNYTVRELSD